MRVVVFLVSCEGRMVELKETENERREWANDGGREREV